MLSLDIYTDNTKLIFLEQLIPNYKLNYKTLDDLKKNNISNQGGIIFLNNPLPEANKYLNKLVSNYLLITNKFIDKQISKKNIIVLKAPLPLNKIKNSIKIFLSNKIINFNNIDISDKKLINSNNNISVPLTDIEKEILVYLINNENCSKDFIKKNILKIKSHIETNSIDSHLTRIRKKLEKIESNIFIKSKLDILSIFINQKN